MVLVHVLKRRPVRRLWVAGLVCCVLLGVELGLDVLYAKRGPVHGLLQLLVLVLALFVFFGRSMVGKALRATAINRVGARLMGIPTGLAGDVSFALAALIGASFLAQLMTGGFHWA